MGGVGEYINETHLSFIEIKDTGKTKVWEVRSNYKEKPLLGRIKWYGGWRRYIFAPLSQTYFDIKCLKTITEFIQEKMDERKKKKKKKKKKRGK